jgi:hypothetical protein
MNRESFSSYNSDGFSFEIGMALARNLTVSFLRLGRAKPKTRVRRPCQAQIANNFSSGLFPLPSTLQQTKQEYVHDQPHPDRGPSRRGCQVEIRKLSVLLRLRFILVLCQPRKGYLVMIEIHALEQQARWKGHISDS